MLENCQPSLVFEQLERIVSSSPLASSPSLRRFLRYVVEETLAGRSGSLKEYSLGVVVFDRGDEFDPRLDPIVRVQARNLRVRLSQYYAGPGVNDTLIIDLPKRTYVPVFRWASAQESAPVPAPPLDLAEEAAESLLPVPVEAQPGPPSVTVVHAPVVVPLLDPRPQTLEPAPRWWPRAISTAAIFVAAVVLTTAFWQTRTAHTARKSIHEPDPAAQDLYIRGRYLMDRQTESALRAAIQSFDQAILRDPQFAPAYAGVAEAYDTLAQYGFMLPGEGMEQARRAAERALEIDPNLAEGHVAMAAIVEAYDWNWAAAEREYRRALELNPSAPGAHLWYGMFLRDQGRMKEALPELRRAAQLDPFSAMTAINLGHAYMMAGNYAEAAEQARHAAEIAPEAPGPAVMLANALHALNRNDEAAASLERIRPYVDDNPHALSVLACIYIRNGNRQEGTRLAQQLDQLSRQRYVSPFDLGQVNLALGNEKRALDLWEEAYRQRSSGLIFLRDAKYYKRISSPAFDSLIARMHFAG